MPVLSLSEPELVTTDTMMRAQEKACDLDLEGIVAKHQHAPYDPEKSTCSSSEIRTIRRWLDARNYLSGRGTRSLFRGGTPALWHLQPPKKPRQAVFSAP